VCGDTKARIHWERMYMMKEIELLYSKGCPNHENALNVLKRILDETGMEYKSKEIEVNSWEEAVSKGFLCLLLSKSTT